MIKSDSLPEILFIIPIFNEEANILSNIENILSLTYRYKQIIAVNDGSEDSSLNLLKEKLELEEVPRYHPDEIPTQKVKTLYRSKKHPNIIVLDKDKGGKYDAINAAINAAPTPFLLS